VVAGHSFGGMLAAEAGASDTKLLGVAMISAWNLGDFAARARADGEAGRAAFTVAMTDNRESLAGCTPQGLTAEAFAGPTKWDFLGWAPALAPRPLLLLSSHDGNGPQSDELGKRVRAAGGTSVTETTLPTDHSFSDHRIALAAALVRWLASLPN
jgi:acetyl esterase/lipase